MWQREGNHRRSEGKRGRKAKGESVALVNRERDDWADSIKLLPISILALADLLKTGQKDMLNLLLPCASLFCSSERNQSVLLQKQLETEKTLVPCCLAAAVQGLLGFQPLQRLHWQNVCCIWRSTMWQWKNLRETKQGRGEKREGREKRGGGRIKWERGSKPKAEGQKSKEK